MRLDLIRLQYSTDRTTWAYIDGATGPAVAIDAAANPEVSGWVTLAAGAKADVYIRIVGIGGDGVVDPTFGTIIVQYR